jgi:hypothetical protein
MPEGGLSYAAESEKVTFLNWTLGRWDNETLGQ